ncbi:MAG: hypothetical protein QNL90_16425, partial [Gammaproteobacteria bacterium]|nr:hypothetical protein [Gammaproteobacteria bacterium]MDX2461737.1 hypothetical protein [Gammaproteobacteria bacterium]
MQQSTDKWQRSSAFRTIRTATSGLGLLAALSACASPGTDPGGTVVAAPDPNTRVATRDAYLAATGVDVSGNEVFSRRVNGATGLLGIMLKTYTTDPLLRPVS